MKKHLYCFIAVLIPVLIFTIKPLSASYPEGINEIDLAPVFNVRMKGVIADSTLPETFVNDAVFSVKKSVKKFRRFRLTDDQELSSSRKEFTDFIKTKSGEKRDTSINGATSDDTPVAEGRYYIFLSLSDYNENTDVSTNVKLKGKESTATTVTTRTVSFTVTADFADTYTGKSDSQTFILTGSVTDEKQESCISMIITGIISAFLDSNNYGEAQSMALRDFQRGFLSSLEKNKNSMLWIQTTICAVNESGNYLNKGKFWDVNEGDEFKGAVDTGADRVYLRVRDSKNRYSSAYVLSGTPAKGAELERLDRIGFGLGVDCGVTVFYSAGTLASASDSAIQTGKFSTGNNLGALPFIGFRNSYDIGYTWRVMMQFSYASLPEDDSGKLEVADFGFGGGRRFYFGMTSLDLYMLAGLNGAKFNHSVSSVRAAALGLTVISANDVRIETDANSIYLKPGIALNRQFNEWFFLTLFADCSVLSKYSDISVKAKQKYSGGGESEIFSEEFSGSSLKMFVPRVGVSAVLRF